MSKRPIAAPLAVALAAGAALSPVAVASIARALELPELVTSADRIVVADVVSVASAWDAPHRNIHTTVEIAVRESWKGESPASGRLTLRQLGGPVGDIEMSVVGAAKFVPGERALFFLDRQRLVGMAQGKRALRWEAASRRWSVEPCARAGAMLVARDGRVRAEIAPAEDLDSLRRRVARLLGN